MNSAHCSKCVCTWMGQIQRKHFTAGCTLYNCVCDKKKTFFLPISDNGKRLKYRSISSFIEVSTILCLHMYVGYPNLSVYVMF